MGTLKKDKQNYNDQVRRHSTKKQFSPQTMLQVEAHLGCRASFGLTVGMRLQFQHNQQQSFT